MMDNKMAYALERLITNTGDAAMILSLTKKIGDEEEVKAYLGAHGFSYAVTEIGGNTSYVEFQEKATKSVLAACINLKVIERTEVEIHAVLHAAEEAKSGFSMLSIVTNVTMKIAIVRKDPWISIAMTGLSAGHPKTNHMRAGVGTMHICKVNDGC